MSIDAEVNEQDNNGLSPLHLTLGGQQRQLPGVRTLIYLRTRSLKQYMIVTSYNYLIFQTLYLQFITRHTKIRKQSVT